MRKLIALLFAMVLVVGLLTGCTGDTVVVYNCTCGDDTTQSTTDNNASDETASGEAAGALKTGLAVITSAKTTDAAADAEGAVEYDVTLVAVLVDESGVIADCAIDSIGASVKFNTSGDITSDVTAAVQTKNELGDDYGMVAWGGAVAEWHEQAEALAQFAVGKTVEELKKGAVGETGYAQDADLATSATIYLGGYVSAIETAVNSAKDLGAKSGDELILSSINGLDSSKDGTAQLDSNAVALTVKDGVITSCYLDAVQATASINGSGKATVENTQSKNELGDDCGMVAWGGAAFEWYEQAENFSAYVTGKTAAEVAGIAVDESTYPADADLSSSVTIAIGGFQALIAKAMQ